MTRQQNRIAVTALGALTLCMSPSVFGREFPKETRQIDPQTNIANQMKPDEDTPSTLRIYSQMLSFGECWIDADQELVDNVLGAQPHSATESWALRELQSRGRGCQTGEQSPILALQRGSLAEAAYHKSGTRWPIIWQMSQQGYDKFSGAEMKFNALRKANDREMIRATDCLAALAPVQAEAVLATKHGSKEEGAAMNAVFSGAPACAGAKRPADLSRSFLRAFLADSVYRRSLWTAEKQAAYAARAGN